MKNDESSVVPAFSAGMTFYSNLNPTYSNKLRYLSGKISAFPVTNDNRCVFHHASHAGFKNRNLGG